MVVVVGLGVVVVNASVVVVPKSMGSIRNSTAAPGGKAPGGLTGTNSPIVAFSAAVVVIFNTFVVVDGRVVMLQAGKYVNSLK